MKPVSKLALIAAALLTTAAAPVAPPPIEGFGDAIHHWQNRNGKSYARYAESDVTAIADNILLLQHDNGGWIENRDPLRILSDAEKAEALKDKSSPNFSFDNRNIYTQVDYLMRAHSLTGKAAYREAALKGLELILSQQVATCGGWPHSVPSKTTYHDKITMADEVTSGNLRLLRHISIGDYPFDKIETSWRERAKAALTKGDACLLKLQIRQNGQLTGWAGQYDPVTLAPVKGRSFELISIVSQESVENVRYLMSIPNPSLEVIASVEGAVAWFQRSAITGKRLETFALPAPVKYDYHTATTDNRLIDDPNAPLLWARFYDIGDNSVILANRDGVRVRDYADIHPERRSGYGWYGTWAQSLISVEYPRWKKRITPPM
ncbi:pectate lyase [Asticcacaulis sp. BYS171W]|uniref:Pectate lyase n=1 Tax=Asticcacaulis aquaticus TaxID=2984212 RepID=A0ABT5HYQ1_9CAUL|nr:pectate lyase [Asticcacaulis aquaticus]MDC7685201.1 pectate lyase [Asticcacaulis aquaticus]